MVSGVSKIMIHHPPNITQIQCF